MSKFPCDAIISWQAECIFLSFSLGKKKQLCLLKKLTVIVCSWFKWIAEILCVLFSGYQTCQSEIFFRVGDFCKYIYSWKRWFLVKTLVESNFFLHWSEQTIKVRNVYMHIWNIPWTLILIHCHLKLIFLCMKDAAWNDDVYLHLHRNLRNMFLHRKNYTSD